MHHLPNLTTLQVLYHPQLPRVQHPRRIPSTAAPEKVSLDSVSSVAAPSEIAPNYVSSTAAPGKGYLDSVPSVAAPEIITPDSVSSKQPLIEYTRIMYHPQPQAGGSFTIVHQSNRGVKMIGCSALPTIKATAEQSVPQPVASFFC